MARKRERFERSDMPHDSAHRTRWAIIALVIIAIVLVLIVRLCWALAMRDSNLGDSDLSSSLAAQSTLSAPIEGYTSSSDVFTNVLLLTVDDIYSDSPTLLSAQLLSLDATTSKGILVSLPLDSKVSNSGGETTLSALFASSGAAACVAPLAAAGNITVSHVVVATSDVWDEVGKLKGSGVQSIVSSASGIFNSIKTDMDVGTLMDLAELVQSIGVSNFTKVDAPVSDGTLGDGTPVKALDQIQLGVAIGALVASS